MKSRPVTKRATRTEAAYVKDLRKRSALTMVDEDKAELLLPEDYPEPLRRLLTRERNMVHIKLSAPIKRKLEARSRKLGLAPDELAKRWVEQHLKRSAG